MSSLPSKIYKKYSCFSAEYFERHSMSIVSESCQSDQFWSQFRPERCCSSREKENWVPKSIITTLVDGTNSCGEARYCYDRQFNPW